MRERRLIDKLNKVDKEQKEGISELKDTTLSRVSDRNIASNSNILPKQDQEFNLGSSSKRWNNIYTGDLHLRNERGDWTIVEERDFLCVINNITGKKYRMVLHEIEDQE